MPAPSDAFSGDAVVGFAFQVELEGKVTGYFTEISGLDVEFEVSEFKIMDDKGQSIIRKTPGRATAGEVTIKRGVTTNMDAWAWRKEIENGMVADARTNGTITALSQDLTPVAEWTFERAWPSNITVSSPDAGSSDPVTEELTIQFEALDRVL